jgi:hypothetical protein
LGFVTGIILSSRPTAAQYTADFQTNIISGVTSNWTGDYYVGNFYFSCALLVQNSGMLSNGVGYLGYDSSNNSVLVTDSGSIWSNQWGSMSVVAAWATASLSAMADS